MLPEQLKRWFVANARRLAVLATGVVWLGSSVYILLSDGPLADKMSASADAAIALATCWGVWLLAETLKATRSIAESTVQTLTQATQATQLAQQTLEQSRDASARAAETAEFAEQRNKQEFERDRARLRINLHSAVQIKPDRRIRSDADRRAANLWDFRYAVVAFTVTNMGQAQASCIKVRVGTSEVFLPDLAGGQKSETYECHAMQSLFGLGERRDSGRWDTTAPPVAQIPFECVYAVGLGNEVAVSSLQYGAFECSWHSPEQAVAYGPGGLNILWVASGMSTPVENDIDAAKLLRTQGGRFAPRHL